MAGITLRTTVSFETHALTQLIIENSTDQVENERAESVQSPVNKENAVEKKLSPSRPLQNQYKGGMISELDLIEHSKDKKGVPLLNLIGNCASKRHGSD
jgi:hypothetical protein